MNIDELKEWSRTKFVINRDQIEWAIAEIDRLTSLLKRYEEAVMVEGTLLYDSRDGEHYIDVPLDRESPLVAEYFGLKNNCEKRVTVMVMPMKD